MTQDELAKKSGLSQQYISVIESADRKESPTLTSIIKLSQALSICPYSLFILQCDICFNQNKCDIVNIIEDKKNLK